MTATTLLEHTVQTFFVPSELSLDDLFAALGAAEFDFAAGRRSTRSVFDTFDGRLHAADLRLELCEGEQRELVLHGPTGSPPVRVAWPGEPPATAEDLPGGPFGSRVAAAIGERALLAVLQVMSLRSEATRRDRRGKPIVTVSVHDRVTASGATSEQPLRVVEVATTLGSEAAARLALAPLASLGLRATPGDLVDAVVAFTGSSLEGHRADPTVPMQRHDDAFESFRSVLRNLLATAVDNVPGTLADLDPEFLHDFRVALRRTRAVLSESKHVFPGAVRERFRADLAGLAAATGDARDLDVYAHTWPDTIAAVGLDDPTVVSPLRDELLIRRRRARATLSKVMRSRATTKLLDDWDTWLNDADATPPYETSRPIGPYIASRITKAQSRVVRDGRLISPESPAERLHDLRKDAKRLRYLFECFGSVLPPKGRKAFVAQLKALQDNLGLHQDAEVQTNVLRALAYDLHAQDRIGPDALLAVGRIIDQLERVRQAERDAFAARFAAYDTAENRTLLAELLDKAATP